MDVLLFGFSLFAVSLLLLCLLAGRRAARSPRRLILESLPDRICPATATWNGPEGGAWNDKDHWTWDAGALNGMKYPGDTGGRFDDVKFDGTIMTNCTLGVSLTEKLESLEVKTAYANKTVTLNGDVKVGAGGFKEAGGTVSVGANKTLELTAGAHSWSGGAIAGAGTLKVYQSVLTISSAAGLMKAQLVVAGTEAAPGVVYLGGIGGSSPMDGNLNLDGVGKISVQDRGTLALRQDVAAADAFAKGGIVGGATSRITVSAGGTMSRGFDAPGVGGSVLVGVPVKIDGGTFQLFRQQGGVGEQQKSVIKFDSAFADGNEQGYAVALTGDDGQILHGLSADVIAPSGVLVSGWDSTYSVTVGAGLGQSLTGSLTYTVGGHLKLLSAVNGVTGTFDVVGNLTLASITETSLNWNATGADVINVTNYAYLGGFLKMFGVGPTDPQTSVTVFTAYYVATPFVSHVWVGGNGTLSGYSSGPAYYVYWSVPQGGGL